MGATNTRSAMDVDAILNVGQFVHICVITFTTKMTQLPLAQNICSQAPLSWIWIEVIVFAPVDISVYEWTVTFQNWLLDTCEICCGYPLLIFV